MRGAFDFWRVVESNNKNDDTCIGIGITNIINIEITSIINKDIINNFNNQTL